MFTKAIRRFGFIQLLYLSHFFSKSCFCSSLNEPLVGTKGSASLSGAGVVAMNNSELVCTLEMLPISLHSIQVFKFHCDSQLASIPPLSWLLCLLAYVAMDSSSCQCSLLSIAETGGADSQTVRQFPSEQGRGVEAESTAAARSLVSLHNTDYNPEI